MQLVVTIALFAWQPGWKSQKPLSFVLWLAIGVLLERINWRALINTLMFKVSIDTEAFVCSDNVHSIRKRGQ